MDSVYVGVEVTADITSLHVRTCAFPACDLEDAQRAVAWQAERPDRRSIYLTRLVGVPRDPAVAELSPMQDWRSPGTTTVPGAAVHLSTDGVRS